MRKGGGKCPARTNRQSVTTLTPTVSATSRRESTRQASRDSFSMTAVWHDAGWNFGRSFRPVQNFPHFATGPSGTGSALPIADDLPPFGLGVWAWCSAGASRIRYSHSVHQPCDRDDVHDNAAGNGGARGACGTCAPSSGRAMSARRGSDRPAARRVLGTTDGRVCARTWNRCHPTLVRAEVSRARCAEERPSAGRNTSR